MSLYAELLERVSRGAKFNINLVEKTLKVDGKEIVLEGNLIDDTEYNKWDAWQILENLYARYKRSVPTSHQNGNKPYFKACNVEDLTDDELAFNLDRNYAQAMIEAYVLLGSLSGWFEWQNDKHWFWQGTDKELVVLREWI